MVLSSLDQGAESAEPRRHRRRLVAVRRILAPAPAKGSKRLGGRHCARRARRRPAARRERSRKSKLRLPQPLCSWIRAVTRSRWRVHRICRAKHESQRAMPDARWEKRIDAAGWYRTRLFDTRASGVLMHPTSLPGRHGLGDLGADAHRFAELLATAGQSLWQMLPIGPIGAGNSPYSSPSSFAGSPLLVSLDRLVSDGLLSAHESEPPHRLARAKKADYSRRAALSRAAFARRMQALCRPCESCSSARVRRNSGIPTPSGSRTTRCFARFSAKRAGDPGSNGQNRCGAATPRRSRRRASGSAPRSSITSWCSSFSITRWRAFRAHCRALGIRLLGDVPMFVAHDAAEVWQMSDAFKLDENGRKLRPGRSTAGQLQQDRAALGQSRLRLESPAQESVPLLGDAAAISHSVVSMRCDSTTSSVFIASGKSRRAPEPPETRRFVYVPGSELLARLSQELGGLPFVAEDLGIVTPEVHALRDQFALPGMRVCSSDSTPALPSTCPTAIRRVPWLARELTTRTRLSGWFSGLGCSRQEPSLSLRQRSDPNHPLGYDPSVDGVGRQSADHPRHKTFSDSAARRV